MSGDNSPINPTSFAANPYQPMSVTDTSSGESASIDFDGVVNLQDHHDANAAFLRPKWRSILEMIATLALLAFLSSISIWPKRAALFSLLLIIVVVLLVFLRRYLRIYQLPANQTELLSHRVRGKISQGWFEQQCDNFTVRHPLSTLISVHANSKVLRLVFAANPDRVTLLPAHAFTFSDFAQAKKRLFRASKSSRYRFARGNSDTTQRLTTPFANVASAVRFKGTFSRPVRPTENPNATWGRQFRLLLNSLFIIILVAMTTSVSASLRPTAAIVIALLCLLLVLSLSAQRSHAGTNRICWAFGYISDDAIYFSDPTGEFIFSYVAFSSQCLLEAKRIQLLCVDALPFPLELRRDWFDSQDDWDRGVQTIKANMDRMQASSVLSTLQDAKAQIAHPSPTVDFSRLSN